VIGERFENKVSAEKSVATSMAGALFFGVAIFRPRALYQLTVARYQSRAADGVGADGVAGDAPRLGGGVVRRGGAQPLTTTVGKHRHRKSGRGQAHTHRNNSHSFYQQRILSWLQEKSCVLKCSSPSISRRFFPFPKVVVQDRADGLRVLLNKEKLEQY